MATKREIEDRLRKYKSEYENSKLRIKLLEQQLDEAQANQLTPAAARALLGEDDDLILKVLDYLYLHCPAKEGSVIQALTSYVKGETIAEFLKEAVRMDSDY